MSDEIQIIGQEKNIELFRRSLVSLKGGKGSIIGISGEAGMGKTYLLNAFSKEAGIQEVPNIFVSCQAPIGKFKVGNIQPMLPFSRAIEKILNKDYISAEKKFAKRIGLTVLAALPITGEVFYAVKELGRDWREFKRDKSSSTAKKTSSAVADYYDTIRSFTDKIPLVIFMDDIHWSDAQSIELLSLFGENITSIPLILVLTFKKSVIESYSSPMLSFLMQYSLLENIHILDILPFGNSELSHSCKALMPNYKHNKDFEDWIFRHSYGVPGVVIEYLKYFQRYPPFDKDGNFQEDISEGEFLPASVHTAFSQVLENLTEDDRNILAICSAEGREFTVNIVSNLLNLDILTTIKKLRQIQTKTNIIKSDGAHIRYGVKTTTYKFTQAFYHTYFENSLEYEEHIALHGQIAALLKQKYEEAESEAVRQQIAPYLAAHSSESGDEDTAKSMLLLAAQAAQKYGASEVVQDAYQSYMNIEQGIEEEETENDSAELDAFREIARTSALAAQQSENGNNNVNGAEQQTSDDAQFMDFKTMRKVIIEDYHSQNYTLAIDRALSFLNNYKSSLREDETSQILALLIKSYIENGDFERAENYCEEALGLIEKLKEPIAECLVMNACAVLRSYQNRHSDAYDFLKQAAEKAVALPPELRLLTITNIAKLTESNNPQEARAFYNAAAKLCDKLGFKDFEKQALR